VSSCSVFITVIWLALADSGRNETSGVEEVALDPCWLTE
jgi:hypothetical protein